MKFIFLMVLIFAACLSEPDCMVAVTNVAVFNFKKKDGKTADTLWVDSVRVSGLKKVIAYHTEDAAKRGVTGLKIPLNPFDNQTTHYYYYRRKSSKKQEADTITFSYFKNAKVISKKCGAFIFYEDLSVVKTTALSVRIVQSQLFTTATSNAEIVF